jgi:hypothetical protein
MVVGGRYIVLFFSLQFSIFKYRCPMGNRHLLVPSMIQFAFLPFTTLFRPAPKVTPPACSELATANIPTFKMLHYAS